MLETKCVGDNIELLVTVLAVFVINIFYLLTLALDTNNQRMSPISKFCHSHQQIVYVVGGRFLTFWYFSPLLHAHLSNFSFTSDKEILVLNSLKKPRQKSSVRVNFEISSSVGLYWHDKLGSIKPSSPSWTQTEPHIILSNFILVVTGNVRARPKAHISKQI